MASLKHFLYLLTAEKNNGLELDLMDNSVVNIITCMLHVLRILLYSRWVQQTFVLRNVDTATKEQ